MTFFTQSPVKGRWSRLPFVLSLLAVSLSAALLPAQGTTAAASIGGLHVVGNQIENGSGQVIRLLGVDRSGSEYACIGGWGFFDGPSDAASVQAMAAWHINAVRVPLNEDCWLGINGSPAAYSGSNYQQAIENYVSLLNQNGLAAILELHWNAPGTAQATGQQPMPDQDHAPAFWQSVATAFKGNSSVLFDLYNEPYPDNNGDTTAAWTCWKNGGTCSGVSYQVAGMQELVTTIRNTGATNIIMAGGVQYADSLSQWLSYKPADPTGNLVASWHTYAGQVCSSSSCWNQYIAPVAAQVPVVTGEIGENDCATSYINTLMPWLDSHGISYLAWAWDTYDCASFPSLISDYAGTPTAFGQGFQAHLAALASSTPTPTGTGTSTTPTPTNTPVPPTASPTGGSSPQVTINSASANPTSIGPGGSVKFSTAVTSTSAISGAIIDFEVYNSAGTKVEQTYQSTNLPANTRSSFSATWAIPSTEPAGTYTLDVGVFGSGWSPNYAWKSSASTITISSAATSTPTTTTSKLGLTSVGNAVDSGDSNGLTASAIVTGSRAETVSSVSAYVGAVGASLNNQYSFAIYSNSNGAPGSLLAKSAAGSLKPNSWNTLPLSASLNANTTYWLVYNANGSNGSVDNLYYDNASGNVGAYSSSSVSFGSWPSSFGNASLGPWQYSLYATASP